MHADTAETAIAGIRWGLCCQFADSGVRFRQATHRYVATLPTPAAAAYLRGIARANAIALAHAVLRCVDLGVGAFRITSQILPLTTHPVSGYTLGDLDEDGSIRGSFEAAGRLARELDVRLSFHPDQFVVINSMRDDVVASSIRELEAQATLGQLVGADTITLHVGGMAGGKADALARLERNLDRLSDAARVRLALENDDRLFTVRDLHPLCLRASVPLVYDVHHHRCNPDGLDVATATAVATETWGGREPWMHIASPRDGATARNPRPHADYVSPEDFPREWFGRVITVDVEAKAKDAAILALRDELRRYHAAGARALAQ
ncbi:MAG TPA: UV DNA damage repair endonuclease UvsE [Gemmatimonadaceae bacterium]|jgi:UV DNA damage endonuclease|nr:UV DNA damage repair endonuclease UvsE [Gemmatimonadaceae bacterium]